MKSRPKDEPVTEYMKKAATAWHALPEKRRKVRNYSCIVDLCEY